MSDNEIFGTDGNDNLTGTAQRDAMYGGAGDDELDGGTGGADRFDGGEGTDTVSYASATQRAFVRFHEGWRNDDAARGDTYFGIENIRGSQFDDNLCADEGDNLIWGEGGDDCMFGLEGDDTLMGGDGNDTLIGGAGADHMNGWWGDDKVSYRTSTESVTVDFENPENNTNDAAGDTYWAVEDLEGSDFNDTLTGNNLHNMVYGNNGDDLMIGKLGNDTFTGGQGADTLDGGEGEDIASYATMQSHSVKVNLSDTSQNNGDAAGDVYISIEGVEGTRFNDELTGNEGRNLLFGGEGDDMLDGGVGGADFFDGGEGVDTVTYQSSTQGVFVRAMETWRNDDGARGDTYENIENLYGSNFDDNLCLDDGDNLIWGADGDDCIFGLAGDDTLMGDEGNDTLIGGAGADHMNGSWGDDKVSYRTSTEAVTASLADGAGTAGDAAGDTFFAIEDLEGGAGDDNLTGDSWHNVISGNGGNDTLIGLAGNDTFISGQGADMLDGGEGEDVASYATMQEGGVIVNMTDTSQNTGDAAGDTYMSVEGIEGTRFNDVLTGDEGRNLLYGGQGDDMLDGGAAGADFFDGGEGTDTASYASATQRAFVRMEETWRNDDAARGDTYESIENLRGSQFDDNLCTDDGDNILWGDDGNDCMFGLDGEDTIYGGADQDTLIGGADGDLLDGGAGIDKASYRTTTESVIANLSDSSVNTGHAAGDTYVDIEDLEGGSAADILTGDSGNNMLAGNDGADQLFGEGGNDVLMSGAGADTLHGGTGIDIASYSNMQAHSVRVNLATMASNNGDAAGDVFISIEGVEGTQFNDELVGDFGNNIFIGGDGDDQMHGNEGADTFVFNAGETGVDVIYDFSVAQGDKLNIFNMIGNNAGSVSDLVTITQNADSSTVSAYDDTLGATRDIATLMTNETLDASAIIDMGFLV